MTLKLLHTADWHLGLRFPALDRADELQLTRSRLQVVERLLGLAERYAVDAVLCAGDLFDDPHPEREWWQGLAEVLQRPDWPARRPIVLLPGNHDPLLHDSVWSPQHPFRGALPPWVKVVDHDAFTLQLGPQAQLFATPCRSRAGDGDPTAALPARPQGDEQLRIGLVHGQTFDIDGHQSNFPIARDAARRLGLDYLALGDTHSFRQVPGEVPAVYPGAPEPTRLGEEDAGNVVLVFFRRHGRPPRIVRERVGRWRWRHETCRDLASLRRLVSVPLQRCVLRLDLDLTVSLGEQHELCELLDQLRGTTACPGRAGILQLGRRQVTLGSTPWDESFQAAAAAQLSPPLRTVAERLEQLRQGSGPDRPAAERALSHLYRLVREELG